MTEQQNNFFKMAVPAAQESQCATGVPASITIAQAALESGWGASQLSRRANNYFGIKIDHFGAPDTYIEMPTEEYIQGRSIEELQPFARYTTVAAAFSAHGYLLSKAPRYAVAMADRTDAARFALDLERCGYSTDPDYAFKLMQIVREFDLTQYDILPDGPATAAAAA